MPRALLRDILLEKKKDLKYPTEGQFYAKLDILKSSCLNVLLDVTAVENVIGGEVGNTKAVRDNVKEYMSLIGKMRSDREKYQWNDESVQDMVDKLESDIQTAFEDTKKAREQDLGKNDSLKFADDYFLNAEALKEKGNYILFTIASIEAQEKKAKEFRKTSDPTQQGAFDDKLDIVAKKGIEKKEGESDDDFKKRQEEQKKLDVIRKEGIIRLVASLLGVTYEDQILKYDKAEEKDKLATRIAMFNEVMPYIEAMSGRKYERCSEKEGKGIFDPQFVADLSVLAEYRGYYSEKYYKSSRPVEGEEEKEEEVFSEEDYKKIEEKMKTSKQELKDLLDKLKNNNTGEDEDGKKRDSIKNKKMVEIIEEAEAELDSIELKYACSLKNMKSLETDKKEFQDNLEKYSSSLDAKDKEIIGEMVLKIEEIQSFCKKMLE